jgi:hypothetical protein
MLRTSACLLAAALAAGCAYDDGAPVDDGLADNGKDKRPLQERLVGMFGEPWYNTGPATASTSASVPVGPYDGKTISVQFTHVSDGETRSEKKSGGVNTYAWTRLSCPDKTQPAACTEVVEKGRVMLGADHESSIDWDDGKRYHYYYYYLDVVDEVGADRGRWSIVTGYDAAASSMSLRRYTGKETVSLEPASSIQFGRGAYQPGNGESCDRFACQSHLKCNSSYVCRKDGREESTDDDD